MKNFLKRLFRTVLFLIGFMAFILVIGESIEGMTPSYVLTIKIAALAVIWAICKVWWFSLSPAEKMEIEREEV